MQATRRSLTLALLVVVLLGTNGIAAGHETTTVRGYSVTFGGADEPVITGERMWMQVEILDEETNEPVGVPADAVAIAVQRPFGNDTFDLPVSGVHGRPGWYEGAVVFTQPGTYTVFITAEIDGETIETNFTKKVHPTSDLQYPATSSESASPVGGDVAAGFGIGAGVTAAGMLVAFLLGRRWWG